MLGFNWDAGNLDHIAAHRVTPHEIEEVFANAPMDQSFDVINGEERYTSIGHTNLLRILIVVWTLRGEAIRPITAFDACPSLANEYRTYCSL